MNRYLLRTWIFILAFCFGISVSAAWRIFTLPAVPEPVAEPVAAIVIPEIPDELRIVGGTHACGASPDGAIYELSDGSRIEIKCTKFRSGAAAKEEFDRRVSLATIEDLAHNIDVEGKQDGDKILITKPHVQSLKVHGRLLCVTEAPSLEHLRWFQKPHGAY
jgi:hypothetical protein